MGDTLYATRRYSYGGRHRGPKKSPTKIGNISKRVEYADFEEGGQYTKPPDHKTRPGESRDGRFVPTAGFPGLSGAG